jgi:hypothetical protein
MDHVENTIPLLVSSLLGCPHDRSLDAALQQPLFPEPLLSNDYCTGYFAVVA